MTTSRPDRARFPEVPDVPGVPEGPASLVRLGRTGRFRRAVRVMAAALELDEEELSGQLVPPCWPCSRTPMSRDLTEPDWWRLLDALLLIAAHPATS